MPEPVIIVAYDPAWPGVFESLRAPVAGRLGTLAVAIEQVGSTSVPGLAAKPIIDMDVVVASIADVPAAIEALATLGYEHRGDLGVPGREAFGSPAGLPAHHLYVCAADASELRRHIAFRDYLRAHVEAADAYAALKHELVLRFRDDRVAYTDGKEDFVKDVLRRAGVLV